jgi:hypothetical protein
MPIWQLSNFTLGWCYKGIDYDLFIEVQNIEDQNVEILIVDLKMYIE